MLYKVEFKSGHFRRVSCFSFLLLSTALIGVPAVLTTVARFFND